MTNTRQTAQSSPQVFPIVAIGASAGGMLAIEELLRALDPETGMGFVIIMHLEANRKSLYPEIIARMTSMRVFEAKEGSVIERNCVYVMPAGVTLTVAEGILHTAVRTESPAHNKPIDRFFRTLAANSKDLAVGIVLSGGDGDGSEGCKSIEAVGGQMFIQDPKTAVQESMPIKAAHKGCDDFIGSPRELAEKLSRFSAASNQRQKPTVHSGAPMNHTHSRLILLAGIVLFGSASVVAAELPPVNERGQFSAKSAGIRMLNQNGPKLQRGEVSGTISAYDGVSQRISVVDVKGNVSDFQVDSNTPIADHHLQISFADLRAGDHVNVHYNVEPRLVNAIEKN